MFRGFSALNLDVKGRLAVPRRYRTQLEDLCNNLLVVTLNPLDRCLWLYPLPEWEVIEAKLQGLSDFDRQSRRTKQIMRGYATDCEPDKHGRILVPQKLREFAGLTKPVVFLGQGNKFEIWDEEYWNDQREEWLSGIDERSSENSQTLAGLAL